MLLQLHQSLFKASDNFVANKAWEGDVKLFMQKDMLIYRFCGVILRNRIKLCMLPRNGANFGVSSGVTRGNHGVKITIRKNKDLYYIAPSGEEFSQPYGRNKGDKHIKGE